MTDIVGDLLYLKDNVVGGTDKKLLLAAACSVVGWGLLQVEPGTCPEVQSIASSGAYASAAQHLVIQVLEAKGLDVARVLAQLLPVLLALMQQWLKK